MLPWMRRTECAPFPWRASLQSGVLETRGCMRSSNRAWSAVPCRWRHRRARSRRKLRAGWRERTAAQTEMCPNTHTHTRYMRPLLVIPSTRRTTLGDRAFPVTAARAWNALPSSVRSAPSLLQFRRDLKTALHVSVIVLFTIVFGCVTDCSCNL